jgi:Fe-S-cluster-containing hydrogenase component 2
MKILKIEADKCTGCMNCALACSLKKFGECNPGKAAIRVERDAFKRYEVPLVCVHCEDPVCLIVCPQNAYVEKENVIVHESDKCILCGMCALLCPNLGINYTGDEIIKCDLCGGEPVCINYCSTDAIEFVEAETVVRTVREQQADRVLSSKRLKQITN